MQENYFYAEIIFKNKKASGLNPPKPVSSFAHFNFDEQLMKAIRKSEFTQPTPIQGSFYNEFIYVRN